MIYDMFTIYSIFLYYMILNYIIWSCIILFDIIFCIILYILLYYITFVLFNAGAVAKYQETNVWAAPYISWPCLIVQNTLKNAIFSNCILNLDVEKTICNAQ